VNVIQRVAIALKLHSHVGWEPSWRLLAKAVAPSCAQQTVAQPLGR